MTSTTASTNPALVGLTETFRDSAYQLKDQTTYRGRRIAQYLIANNENRSLINAEQTIRELVRNNPLLVPVFRMSTPEILRDQISRKKYLIINENALCLSKECETPDDLPKEYIDVYFSQAIIKEPVCCAHNHYLEKRCAQLWTDRMGDICPAGNHSIGNIIVDEEHQSAIRRFTRARRREQRILEDQIILSANVAAQQALAATRPLDSLTILGALGKVSIKLGGKEGLTLLLKAIEKEGLLSIAKHIPVLSFFIGLGLGGYRAYHGEFVKAGVEVASGALAVVPVYGTAASVAVDLGLACHDAWEASLASAMTTGGAMTEHQARAILGLENEELPTKEAVDLKYREQILALHSDRRIDNVIGVNALTDELTRAKHFMYTTYNWA
jgi:hypothetical protein